MDIEILLVNQNDTPVLDSGELSDKLAENGFTLTYITPVDFKSKKIISALDKCADNNEKPSVVILANALSDKGADSFKNIFQRLLHRRKKPKNPKLRKTIGKSAQKR